MQESHKVSPWKTQAEGDYEAFVERLSVKGKAAAGKHDELAGAEGEQGYGEMWKRLVGGLSRLAPHASEMAGHQCVKFHIPDGKYRQQVFALEDTRQGTIVVYLPDIAAKAVERKLLRPGATTGTYKLANDGDAPLELEVINAETRDMTVCKPMVGWGRRALRAHVSVSAKEKQVRSLEMLCELAAEAWAAQLGRAEAEPQSM